jgi:hypothetical protein
MIITSTAIFEQNWSESELTCRFLYTKTNELMRATLPVNKQNETWNNLYTDLLEFRLTRKRDNIHLIKPAVL